MHQHMHQHDEIHESHHWHPRIPNDFMDEKEVLKKHYKQ